MRTAQPGEIWGEDRSVLEDMGLGHDSLGRCGVRTGQYWMIWGEDRSVHKRLLLVSCSVSVVVIQ